MIELGRSRGGRAVVGYRFGTGPSRVSLIAGCHADEPLGPELLRRFVSQLLALPAEHPTFGARTWWIVPHANPDGEVRNMDWAGSLFDDAANTPEISGVDPIEYLRSATREPPGDDVEFGFPRDDHDADARPENAAIVRWWKTDPTPFDLHVSLHGMSVAGGPWFLVDAAWADRCEAFRERCRSKVLELGYRMHNVRRTDDKGFDFIAPGFATRPDSRRMAAHFRASGDVETADLFRPSSMETVRALGGDPLTLVTEMPLFIAPDLAGETPSTDADRARWSDRMTEWRTQLVSGKAEAAVRADIKASGLRPMSLRDQLTLQWATVVAGLELVDRARPTS